MRTTYVEESAKTQAEYAERLRHEREAWQKKISDITARFALLTREITALEMEQAKTIALLVDETNEKRAEELRFHWSELRDLREIYQAETEELRKRQTRLYNQPPPQPALNYDPTAKSAW